MSTIKYILLNLFPLLAVPGKMFLNQKSFYECMSSNDMFLWFIGLSWIALIEAGSSLYLKKKKWKIATLTLLIFSLFTWGGLSFLYSIALLKGVPNIPEITVGLWKCIFVVGFLNFITGVLHTGECKGIDITSSNQ